VTKFYGATLRVLRDKANRAKGKPQVLRNLMVQCKNAVGNAGTDREQARRTWLHIQRLYKQCQNAPNQETAHTTPSTQSG